MEVYAQCFLMRMSSAVAQSSHANGALTLFYAAGEEKVFLRDDADLCFTSQMVPQTLVQGRTGCRAVAKHQRKQ